MRDRDFVRLEGEPAKASQKIGRFPHAAPLALPIQGPFGIRRALGKRLQKLPARAL